jgi:hypothetical protein
LPYRAQQLPRAALVPSGHADAAQRRPGAPRTTVDRKRSRLSQ